MDLISVLRFIKRAEHPHFLSVDDKLYSKWKLIIKFFVKLNKKYKPCEIYRRGYKNIENFVVIGLKYNGKNIKRRTNGFAKEYIKVNKNCKCIYCGVELNMENVTTDHIVPISDGGNNSKVNLIYCCSKCNNDRSNIPFYEYMKLLKKEVKYI
jgi:CRISPR/Cas system Type II protein with McrA/HNH and RuvC-like nuclease domain